MQKVVRTLLLVVVQAAYVAVVLLAIGYLFDYLPKILNSFLLLFVMPVVLAAMIGKFIGVVFKHVINSETVFMMLIITSITVWLPGIFPGLFTVKDYLNISRRPIFEFASVYDYDRHRDAGYVEYADGAPEMKYHAVYIYTSRVKSGDSYTTVRHYRHVTPVLPKDYESGEPVRVWVISDKEKSPLLTGRKSENGVKGMVVHDPYEASRYSKAVKIAEAKHPITSVDHPVFIEPTLLPYSEMLAKKKRYAYWSLGGAVFLWTLPVLIMGLRFKKGELDAESPYGGVLDSDEVQNALKKLQAEINVNSDNDLTDVLFTHKDPEKRAAAATLLGYHEGRHPARVLTKALTRDEHPDVRKAAAWALGYPVSAGRVQSSDDFIVAFNAESDSDIRYVIVLQIGMMADRWDDEAAAAFLIDALPNEPSASVRSIIMENIGRTGGDMAIDAAARVLREDEYEMVRERACAALGEIGGNEAERILLETRQNDESEYVRTAAQKAMRESRKKQNQY